MAEDDVICEIETDKTSVPVPSPAAGVVAELLVDDGATVSPGTKLLKLKLGAGGAPAPPKPAAETAAPAAAAPPPPSPPPPPPPAAASAAIPAKQSFTDHMSLLESKLEAIGFKTSQLTPADGDCLIHGRSYVSKYMII